MPKNIPISVVIPVFNEEENIVHLYEELKKVLETHFTDFEVIFSNDGSRDQTFAKIRALNYKDPRVKGLTFSRNFGHQAALYAGLSKAQGKVVVSMDGDMQHPPSFIPELYKKHQEGFDIVNTRRIDAEDTGFLKKITSKWYYKLINYLSDVPIEPAAADFRLMTLQAVRSLNDMPERHRFTRGLVGWMGYRQAIVDYKAQKRYAGSTKYTFIKMLSFGLDGIVSFSVKPLRIAFYTGFFVSMASLIYAVFAIFNFVRGETVPGWTSTLVSVLLLGGVTLLCLGVIGEYIARIFNEVRRRPMYFISDEVGLSEEDFNFIKHGEKEDQRNK